MGEMWTKELTHVGTPNGAIEAWAIMFGAVTIANVYSEGDADAIIADRARAAALDDARAALEYISKLAHECWVKDRATAALASISTRLVGTGGEHDAGK